MARLPESHRGPSAIAEQRLAYCRDRDLPRLLRLWPEEAARLARDDHRSVLAALRRALRCERRRGIARHWTYDLARHAALLRALRAEEAAADRRSSAAGRRSGLARPMREALPPGE